MRIACVDATAADRVLLLHMLEQAYVQCRAAVGHVSLAKPYPASREEALINDPPELFVVGPKLPLEDSCAVCRELKAAYPHVPVFVFLSPESYSLRTLRRYERLAEEIFAIDEAPVRIVHKITSFQSFAAEQGRGRLVTIHGVKGGVGATSIAAGLAHAAQAAGRKAILVDLSLHGLLPLYMGSARRHSSDLAAALIDGLAPNEALVERCITTAPNGITLFLPPAGGTDVRELWLRSADRFELYLSLIEILRERYDLVIVDLAAAEGVLQFALSCRAFVRLLITSNDPASVHLLSAALTRLSEVPGSGRIEILLNNLVERGLTREDVLDFLCCTPAFERTMARLDPIPYDGRGREWIGTGNTFYTEGSRTLQEILEGAVCLLASDEAEIEQVSQSSKRRRQRRIGRRTGRRAGGPSSPQRLLLTWTRRPAEQLPAEPADDFRHHEAPPVLRPPEPPVSSIARSDGSDEAVFSGQSSTNGSSPSTQGERGRERAATQWYEPPRLQSNE